MYEFLDPEFVRTCVANVSNASGTPDTSPPSKVIVIGGYDGTYTRRVLVDSSGRLRMIGD